MAKGEIITARVERIASGGAGIARPEGKSVFVELTAPGDLACFRIRREHKTWAEAELLEIKEASPFRVAARCPLYGRCGGCSLQHMSYEAQLDAKTAILKDAFTRIAGFSPPEIRLRPSQPFEYRNRVQFHKIEEFNCPSKDICALGSSGIKSFHCSKHWFKTSLGFMERKSSRLAALDDCPVADAGIRAALKERGIQPPDKKRFTVYSHGKTFLVEGGNERGYVSILGRELALDARVFFQSNAVMLELLVADLVEAAQAADRNLPLADIYCGVGTFAAFLGAGFSGVDMLEENESALALARENVRGKNLNFYAAKDSAWIKIAEARQKKSWGFMVLDPPREGLSGPFAKWLAANGGELAAYVSCDPATLARDSRILAEGGYTLKELTLYDFYQQTAHIESLALFARSGQ